MLSSTPPLQDEEDVLYDVKSWFTNIEIEEIEEETINYITEEI